MSSVAEFQSNFDDVVEDAAPAFPLTVVSKFPGSGPSPKRTVARAIEIFGGGDVVVVTAAGESRTLTDLQDPFFLGIKITQITSATAATKVRFYV